MARRWPVPMELRYTSATIDVWIFTKRMRLMLKEQFDVAAAETRIRSQELVDAARALLVDGESAVDIAQRLGVSDPSKINRAAASVEKKWEEICEKRGWSCVAIALPRRLMKAMLLVQAEEIADYQKSREKKKGQKSD